MSESMPSTKERVMRLSELNPRWLNEGVFVFLCPCCKKIHLTCKNIQISRKNQNSLFVEKGLVPYGPEYAVVGTDPSAVWKWNTDDFRTMTVSPSIDASKAGHWHGFIKNGDIT